MSVHSTNMHHSAPVAFLFLAADVLLVNKITIFVTILYLFFDFKTNFDRCVATEFCSDKWKLEKKERIMSAHSTNMHHSAPSSFRIICSRLGSCHKNCKVNQNILRFHYQFWQVWLLNSAQTNEGLRKKNTLWVHIWPMCIILRQAAFLFSAADLNPVNKMAIFVAKSYLDYSLISRPILTGVATKFCSDK